MNRINIVYYSLFSLILIFFIVYLIIVFRDRDYKIGVMNFIKTKTNNKCYDIKITDKNTHDKLYKIMYNFDMVCKKYNLPILAVGMGEKETDLYPFKAEFFTRSLLNINS